MSLYAHVYQTLILPGTARRTWQFWREAERRQWWPAERIASFQLAELKRLLEHAYQHCPWYREQWLRQGIAPADIHTVADFGKVPCLTKNDIRQHHHEMASRMPQGRVYSHSTGGSTGKPLTFFIDRRSYEWRQAIRMRAYNWARAADGEKVAYLWGTPITKRLPLQEAKVRCHDALLRRKILNTYEMNDAILHEYLGRIRRFRPQAIVGYVSSLVSVAQFLQKESSSVAGLHAVLTTAETLFPPQRQLLEEAFQAPVFNSYGSREFMNIASECDRHQGLHVQADNLLVECLRDGQPTRAGEVGELVVTDLHNYGMPFIRYRTEDLAVPEERPCDCGRGLPLLRSVEGRSLDVLQLPDGRLLSGLYFTGLLLEKYQQLQQLQVVQDRLDHLILRIVAAQDQERAVQAFCADVQTKVGPGVALSLERPADLPPNSSGKRRITINQLDQGRQCPPLPKHKESPS